MSDSPASTPDVSLGQLCYDIAYFMLPHYAHKDYAKVAGLCEKMPSAAAPFFYVMACDMKNVEPNFDDAKQFRWHLGKLNRSSTYLVLEYPVPPPIDISGTSPEQLSSRDGAVVLAPYFSAIIRNEATGKVEYFVLGQAPLGGGTTLRCVLRDGMNGNLGPGPEPKLNLFLDAVRARA